MVAARAGGTVLHPDVDGPPTASADFLEEYAPSPVVIVGGERAVGAEVQAALKADYPVHRFGGADRQETAALLAGLAASLPPVKGDKGDRGGAGSGKVSGASGATGPAGPGVPNGGTDQDTAWAAPSTVLSNGTFTGPLISGSPQSFPGSGGSTVVELAAGDASASAAPVLDVVNGEEVSITQTGFHELSGSVRLDTAANSAERYLAVQVGSSAGAGWLPVAESTDDRAGIVVLNAGVTLKLTAGQRVRLCILNSTTGAVAAMNADDPPRLSVVQLPTTQPS